MPPPTSPHPSPSTLWLCAAYTLDHSPVCSCLEIFPFSICVFALPVCSVRFFLPSITHLCPPAFSPPLPQSSYVLHESASGYALFELVQHDDIASLTDEVQASIQDVQRFGRTVKLKAFQPFTSAENALENMNSISEHVLSDDLKHFLELNLPKAKKAGKGTALGVIEPALGTIIQEELSFPCKSDEATREVLRGIRLHFNKYIKELDGGLLEKSQLGLGHSYSRAKV